MKAKLQSKERKKNALSIFEMHLVLSDVPKQVRQMGASSETNSAYDG